MLCQVRLASVRRSLFISDTERSRFLNHLVKGTREILRTQQGLALHANYHEFCRLLGRLKTNYQLAELVPHPKLTSAPLLESACRLHWLIEIAKGSCAGGYRAGILFRMGYEVIVACR